MLFYVFFLKFTIVYTGKLLCVNLELMSKIVTVYFRKLLKEDKN